MKVDLKRTIQEIEISKVSVMINLLPNVLKKCRPAEPKSLSSVAPSSSPQRNSPPWNKIGTTTGRGSDEDVQDPNGAKQAEPSDLVWHNFTHCRWGWDQDFTQGTGVILFPGLRILFAVCGEALLDRTIAGNLVETCSTKWTDSHLQYSRTPNQPMLLLRQHRLASECHYEIQQFKIYCWAQY